MLSYMTRREFSILCSLTAGRAFSAAARKSRNLILLSADGLRCQEMFAGIDPVLMNEKSAGMKDADALRGQLWKPTPNQRRSALLPFFWGTLAAQGRVFGNRSLGSAASVANRHRISYPGYAEILTGRAQDQAIQGNAKVRNPTPTLPQFLKRHWNLSKEQTAIFGSWDMFTYMGENRPGDIYINCGYDPSTLPAGSARVTELNRQQRRALYIADSVRHDAFTFDLAMEYLCGVRPRFLHIALGETDDWAHDRRYDRVLNTIQLFDECLKELWNWIQSESGYRDSTTLIVTTDHGRGRTKDDWTSHGARFADSDWTWLAVFGPDTPAGGEVSNVPACHQRDIAPTALALLGIDYKEYDGVEGAPIAAAMA